MPVRVNNLTFTNFTFTISKIYSLLQCFPYHHLRITIHNQQEGEFHWEGTVQGLILGSFFWGYAFTNIPGGRAAEYLGGKLVFGLGIVASAFLTLVTPVSARTSTELLIAVRFACGAVQVRSLIGQLVAS